MVLKCFGLSDTVNVFSCCLLVLCVNMLRMDHYTVLLSLSTGQASSILPSRRQEEPVDLFNLTLIPLSLSHYINWMSGSFFPSSHLPSLLPSPSFWFHLSFRRFPVSARTFYIPFNDSYTVISFFLFRSTFT